MKEKKMRKVYVVSIILLFVLSLSAYAEKINPVDAYINSMPIKDEGIFKNTINYHFNDVWAYYVDENRWEEIHPSGTLPPATRNHSAAYDPINQRMIVIGGEFNSQIWSLSLNTGSETWSNDSPTSGVFPGGTYGIDIFYCQSLKSIVCNRTESPNRDLYIWNMETDSSRHLTFSSGPTQRMWSAMAIDEKRNRLILYGGGSPVMDDLWSLDLTPGMEHWTELPGSGSLPPEKWLLRAAIDPDRDRFILYGGNSWPNWESGDYRDTTYELDLTTDTWTLVSTITPPSARGQYAVIWDNVSSRMYLFGGLYRVGPLIENAITYNELWAYDSNSQSWFQLLPPHPWPEPRRMATAVFDTLNRRIIVFGGQLYRPVQSAATVITNPRNGRRIDGSSVTVCAELSFGDLNLIRDVCFQYRMPSITGTWTNIIPAGNTIHNPDTESPYFVQWNVMGFPEGSVDLRAVATDIYNIPDSAPDETTVIIDHDDPQTSESITLEGHNQLVYEIDNSAVSDIGVSDGYQSGQYENAACANVRIRIPEGTFTTGTQIIATFVDLAQHPELDPDGGNIGFLADITVPEDQETFPPGKIVRLSFNYPDQDQDGVVDNTDIHELTLKIYTLNDLGGMEEIDNILVDPLANIVSGETDHFSLFTILGTPHSSIRDWDQYSTIP